MNTSRKRTITSIDGKRTVSAREFDRLFDEGSDQIDEFIDWSKIKVNHPQSKRPITLRVDADVLDWFKSLGKGYQTKINAVLRRFKESRERVQSE
ncbi:MAG: BrnA antitoxin family protein [Limisphaerales bacterium]